MATIKIGEVMGIGITKIRLRDQGEPVRFAAFPLKWSSPERFVVGDEKSEAQ